MYAAALLTFALARLVNALARLIWVVRVPKHSLESMTLDLTDDETAALGELLRSTIDGARYPLSPRLAPLNAILAKLDPPQPRPELPPPLKAYDAPSSGRPAPATGGDDRGYPAHDPP